MENVITSVAGAMCAAFGAMLRGCMHLPREAAVPAVLTVSALPAKAADARGTEYCPSRRRTVSPPPAVVGRQGAPDKLSLR
jgi:hypothetical protein